MKSERLLGPAGSARALSTNGLPNSQKWVRFGRGFLGRLDSLVSDSCGEGNDVRTRPQLGSGIDMTQVYICSLNSFI